MPSYFSERNKLAKLRIAPPVDPIDLLDGALLRREAPAAPPAGSEAVHRVAGVFRRRGAR